MQAMILAAGFGTRLQPYTNLRPKPLFPLLNTPLLLLTIRRLQEAGCDHIVVNSHHLSRQVRDLLDDFSGVYLQEEKNIMGTGGGLRLALDLFRDEPLLVTNGDIYHTVDYRNLCEAHIDGGAKVTLAVHDHPRFNGLKINSDGNVGFDTERNGELVAFTGLHMLDTSILRPIRVEQPSCIIDRYKKMPSEGGEIRGVRVDNCYWTDMGTPGDYLELHGGLLQQTIPCWSLLREKIASPFHIAGEAVIGNNISVEDWVCIGRANIGRNVSIRRSVIWDNAVVSDDTIIEDSLVV